MRNVCLAAALAELGAAGIRNVERAYGGKHLQLRWQANGGPRVYSVAITPSDHRAAANVRSGIRRILRADGMLTETTSSSPSPPPSPPKQVDRLAALERRVAVLERALKISEKETHQPNEGEGKDD